MRVDELNTAMRKAFHAAGHTGRGVVFAVFDTGCNPVGWTVGKVEQVAYQGEAPTFGFVPFGAPDYTDKDGHGTFIAGQLIEWCPDAVVWGYKMIGAGDLRGAIDHFYTRVKADPTKRYIANMSFTTPDASIQPYIDKLVDAGVAVFCAAGNDGQKVLDKYPTCFESPITVAALRRDGSKASYSVWHNEVDFAEWGNDVPGLALDGSAVKLSGTSMAAPNLAGKAGLLWSANPSLTEPELFAQLKAMSTDLMDNGKDPYTGWGFVEIETAAKIDREEEPTVPARRVLKLIPKPRMSGNDVIEAQTLLGKHGHAIDVDGIFGTGTDAAVKAFQAAAGLTVDGIVGARTWAALDAAPAKPTEPAPADWITRAEPFLKIMVGDEYVIGAQGHELTKAYLDRRNKSNPGYFTGGRYEWLVQRIEDAAKLGRVLRCEDCSGLFWIIDEAIDLIPCRTDSTADTLYKSYCTPIKKADVRPGDILFRADSSGKMVHMAIVGREATYEAVGTAYGVVARDDTFDRATLNRVTGKVDTLKNWTHYGRLKV